MKNTSRTRTGRHCVFLLHAHLVFITKYRKTVFSKSMLEAMRQIFEKICIDFEVSLIEFEREHDHVHLLVNYPPKITFSKLINSLKGVSSRLLGKKFPEIHNLWRAPLSVLNNTFKIRNPRLNEFEKNTECALHHLPEGRFLGAW